MAEAPNPYKHGCTCPTSLGHRMHTYLCSRAGELEVLAPAPVFAELAEPLAEPGLLPEDPRAERGAS